MKNQKVIIAAVAAIAIAAGVAVSCTKETSTTINQDQAGMYAAKMSGYEELVEIANDFYHKNVVAHQSYPMTYASVCRREDTAGYKTLLNLSNADMARMKFLADSLFKDKPAPNDSCSSCVSVSLSDVRNTVIGLHDLMAELNAKDPKFDTLNPITVSPLHACYARCDSVYENGLLLHNLCYEQCLLGHEFDFWGSVYDEMMTPNPKP